MAEVLHGTHDVDHPLSAARLPAQRSRDSTSPDRPAARYPRAAARGRAKEHPVACRLDSHPERVTRRPVRLGLLEQGNLQSPARLRCEDGPRPLVEPSERHGEDAGNEAALTSPGMRTARCRGSGR